MSAEVLPAGVGRVPTWWMEITPHYTLDEEDSEARQKAEDQMAFYYMQLAAADEAGVLNADGTPKLGPDGQPLSWTPHAPWNGRATGGAGGETGNGAGPGGRNFKPGHPVIDPRLFGIMESDPNYKAYLTGAMLPPGYFETMGQLASSDGGGTQGILNNLKQTDYGRYGRQAETPAFKPAWAKKKLRGTETGANIRQGQYDDSPNKHNRRRVQTGGNAPKMPAMEPEEPEPEPAPEPEPVVASAPVPPQQTMVRQVRSVQKTSSIEEEEPEKPTSQPEQKRYQHSDYYHNAPQLSEQQQMLKEKQDKLKRLQELQRQQQALKAQREQQDKQQQLAALKQKAAQQQQEQAQAAQAEPEYDEMSYEEEIIEEVIDDDDYTEGSYEEEVIDDDGELVDLQAILAAKQAELQRLQAQM